MLRHLEEYLVLAGLTHKSALITWGAFHLKARKKGNDFVPLDDDAVEKLNPPRRGQIGATSSRYATRTARIHLTCIPTGAKTTYDADPRFNHYWVADLQPDTEYEYVVEIDGTPWATDNLDWVPDESGGSWRRGGRYVNRFQTMPAPTSVPDSVSFAVIGDFGVPINRSRQHALVAARVVAAVDEHRIRFIVTAGDNIYAHFSGLSQGFVADGDEDDDWFFTFYQPYRYILNRIPFYPCIGNHDTNDVAWEGEDDMNQLFDNFYMDHRLEGEARAGRAVDNPREAGLFYSLLVGSYLELICLDSTRKRDKSTGRNERLVNHASSRTFMGATFPTRASHLPWKIPFFHHPVFCVGPMHGDTTDLLELPGVFERSRVPLVIAGHEHNLQRIVHNTVEYVVSGAAAKTRTWDDRLNRPKKTSAQPGLIFKRAVPHFLLISVTPSEISVLPVDSLGAAVEPWTIQPLP